MNPGMLAQRLGMVPHFKGPSVILWTPGAKDFRSIEPLTTRLAVRNPRVNFFLVSNDPQLLQAEDLPPVVRRVYACPISLRPVLSLFLARTRPQAILLAAERGSTGLCLAAKRSGIPIHHAQCEGSELLESLQSSMVDETRKHSGKTVERLLGIPGIRRLSERRFREVRSIQVLAEELGHPQRILCLGNGPSSESEEVKVLEAREFDAVFRVNHRWMNRGVFVWPHMVFTAGSKPVRLLSVTSLFCTRDRQRAMRIRLACLHLSGVRRLVIADDLDVLGSWKTLEEEGFGTFAPTNGVVMLAVARALAPRHITVAGVDLFSDPRGAYPGDVQTPNAYGVFHNHEKEREFTLRWIQGVREDGVDLRIIGDVLEAVVGVRHTA